MVFSALIRLLDLPTPGRETPPPAAEELPIDPADLRRMIQALGGPENIARLDNCFTRLRLTVRDASLLDMGTLLALPHKGIVLQGQSLQVVCGLNAARLRRALEEQLHTAAPV